MKRMSVMEAKANDPREYGYLLALAMHPTAKFRERVANEPDLLRAALMAEGWNEYQEETGHVERMVMTP